MTNPKPYSITETYSLESEDEPNIAGLRKLDQKFIPIWCFFSGVQKNQAEKE